jgi:hypothetical protein
MRDKGSSGIQASQRIFIGVNRRPIKGLLLPKNQKHGRQRLNAERMQIENNPVKMGLVGNAESYLWSSAGRKAEMNLGSAVSTACATILSESIEDGCASRSPRKFFR